MKPPEAPACVAAVVVLAATLIAPPVGAADPAQGSVAAHSVECDARQQDRSACLREAGAARQERRSGGLTSAPPAEEQKNALERCAAQPPAERDECEARIRGTGKTTVEGSAAEGGIIRKTETPVQATR